MMININHLTDLKRRASAFLFYLILPMSILFHTKLKVSEKGGEKIWKQEKRLRDIGIAHNVEVKRIVDGIVIAIHVESLAEEVLGST
jgi:hypothetical protein